MTIIELKYIREVPVFFTKYINSRFKSVTGNFFDKKTGTWFFPAYHPFKSKVISDLKAIGVSFSKKAEEYFQQEESFPPLINAPVPCYEHQRVGVEKLLKNWRYILQWEMGTGKSKALIEVLRILKEKTLIFCPSIGVEKWKEEIELHAPGEFNVACLIGPVKKKNEIISHCNDYDIIVVSYETMRLYGLPTPPKKLKETFEYIPQQVLKLVSLVRDKKIQKKLLENYNSKIPLKEIKKEILKILETPQWLKEFDYKIIVADESHRIKHITSKQTKVALKLSNKAKRRYLSTGTLSLGDPRDLYPQLNFLSRALIPENWYEFGKKFLKTSPYNEHIVYGYKNLHILNERVSFISDYKELNECIELPPRQFEKIEVGLSKEQIKVYNQIITEFGADLSEKFVEYNTAVVRLSKLLQLCSGFIYLEKDKDKCDHCNKLMECVRQRIDYLSRNCLYYEKEEEREIKFFKENPKLQALKELLIDLLAEPSHKVIIWTVFQAEKEMIEKLLKQLKVEYVNVKSKEYKKVKRFKEDPRVRVYLAQIQTGIAIDLVSAQYVIYFSRNWSLEDYEQSLARNYRIGQKNKVVVYNICTKETVEVSQLYLLQQKKNIAETLTNKLNCVICNKYEKCSKEGTKLWDKKCKFNLSVPKGNIAPKEIS